MKHRRDLKALVLYLTLCFLTACTSAPNQIYKIPENPTKEDWIKYFKSRVFVDPIEGIYYVTSIRYLKEFGEEDDTNINRPQYSIFYAVCKTKDDDFAAFHIDDATRCLKYRFVKLTKGIYAIKDSDDDGTITYHGKFLFNNSNSFKFKIVSRYKQSQIHDLIENYEFVKVN